MRFRALLLFWTALVFAADKPERRLRVEFDELAARATAILEVVHDAELNLADRGLSLHPDILAARNSVEGAMDDAEKALFAKDWRALKPRLDRARACIEQLNRKY